MKPKILTPSLLLFFTFAIIIGCTCTNATVTVSNVIYPSTILQGETITITVSFNYPLLESLDGNYVYLYYSVNSLTIGNDLYLKYPLSGIVKVPGQITFTIPTVSWDDARVFRFNIRYSWINALDGSGSITSQNYKINIDSVSGNRDMTLIIVLSSCFSACLVAISMIIFIRKKRR